MNQAQNQFEFFRQPIPFSMQRSELQLLIKEYLGQLNELELELISSEISDLEIAGLEVLPRQDTGLYCVKNLKQVRQFLLQREEANLYDILSPRSDSELSMMPYDNIIRYTPQGAICYPTTLAVPYKWKDCAKLIGAFGYKIKQQISKRRHGKVFKCEFTSTNGKIDKLVCKTASIKSAEQLESVESEKKALMRCHHENVINVQNIINLHHLGPYFPDRVLIFMPMAKRNLSEFHKQKFVIPLPVVKDFFIQILKGLSYLHEVDIAHLDIKPENILIFYEQDTGLYNIKLGDLGSVHFTDPFNPSGCNSWPRTPGFEPPEIFQQKKDYNPFQADMWSTGVTFGLLLSNYSQMKKKLNRIITKPKHRYFLTNLLLSGIAADRLPTPVPVLIEAMLKVCPAQRCDVGEALKFLSVWNI